ncbi:MAG: hypothetical protein JSU70_14875 [Phycisphaerales bacterium]|nr:MAG: hypothetical protein JSU70_14875 [Phycisphaerales bacterium]
MTPQDAHVSVIDPISPAFGRVKTILFRPFDLGRWLTIGFCAWLAFLGQGGGGGGGGHGGGRGGGPSNAGEALGQAKDFIMDNLHWIVPLVAVAVVFGLVLWLVFTWLSSRGKFMFLHCVAENKAEVKVPWHKYREHAYSLFLFRIVLGLIGFLAGLFVVLVGIALFFLLGEGLGLGPLAIVVIILSVPIFVAVLIVFGVIKNFTESFVVPIMFLRTVSCTAAWREFLQLLSANKARFLLYILFQIVIGISIGVMIMAAVCITCCCAGCILAIPYVGTVLLLPVLVWGRSYSLYYLRQYGPEYDAFVAESQVVQPAAG